MEGSHARCRPGPQRRAAAQPARAGLRGVRVPVPGRHRRRRALDPGPAVRLAGQGVVGAACRRHGAVRAGRARALPGAVAWRPRSRRGWRARCKRLGRARHRGQGARRGLVRRSTRSPASCRRSWRRWRSSERRAATGCRSRRRSPTSCWRCPARGSTSARCAARRGCRSAWSRRRPRSCWSRATASRASSSTSTGTRTRSPRSSRCPACEAHGRTLPVDPYLLEPLEHFLRTHGVELAPNAREVAGPAAARARRGDRRRPPLARARRRRTSTSRTGSAASCARSSAPASRYALQSRRLFIADEQGLGKTVRGARDARGGRRVPGRRRLPGVAEAQLAARDRALAAAPHR